MSCNFWKNQPVKTVINNDKIKEIMTSKILLNNIEKIVCPIKLNYNVFQSNDIDICKKLQLLEFINEMYINDENDILKLHYSIGLFNFFIEYNCIILEFYFNELDKDPKLIGIIIGKKNKLFIKGVLEEFLEVNFLCLDIQLRNFNITPYMIASLTKEAISIFNINKAYYTIGKNIESKSFCNKNFYHRIINIPKLIKMSFLHSTTNVFLYQKLYNTFSYKTNYMNGKRLLFYNYKLDKESIDIDGDDIAYDICNELQSFYKKKYNIYQCITNKLILQLLKNESFYHFIIQNDYGIPTDYICFFRLDTVNHNKEYYKNGYMYLYFTNDIKSLIEKVTEECFKNKIFDVITLNENFLESKKSDHLKLIKGYGNLKYYMYNVLINNIEPHKNGLITI